ncbi:RNA polymerase sigma-70 factor [Chitinophaga deserti]|uniref:RNA polymerase sigma-70 factor n=1 Tax=Chitinophaga deserti TaxID=2164099 RepID=UPI000D6D7557|nr:RNA polymerase sigma-70 factor [Chitinophaga deserti]
MGESGAHKDWGDAALLRALKNGSMEAFNALYQRYWQLVYNAAFKRLNDGDAAKDITQDFFLQLWNRRSELHILHLPAYIHTAVRNRVLNTLEAQSRFLPVADLLIENTPAADQADSLARRNEWLKSYHLLVDALPPARQEIFRLHIQDGASTEEIARQLNISRKTVQNQLGKALARLRETLGFLTGLLG